MQQSCQQIIRFFKTPLDGVLVLEPTVFSDNRGFFYESWNSKIFYEITGIDTNFVQDNYSRSIKNVLRGLHYQIKNPQGKLISVIHGRVFDVAVDLRRSSSTFGKWFGVELSDENHRQVWIPPGCAHGFVVRSDIADLAYKTTDFYNPDYERCICWNDPTLAITWGLETNPILSQKDLNGLEFVVADLYE